MNYMHCSKGYVSYATYVYTIYIIYSMLRLLLYMCCPCKYIILYYIYRYSGMPFKNAVLILAACYIRITANIHLQHEIVLSRCCHRVPSFQIYGQVCVR